MTDRELMQQALSALVTAELDGNCEYGVTDSLRARLAQPKPEPVAWGVLDDDGQIDWTCDYPFSDHSGWPNSAPLYTTLPQREWVSLTDDELHALHYELKCAAMGATSTLGMYRILETALKEKNGI